MLSTLHRVCTLTVHSRRSLCGARQPPLPHLSSFREGATLPRAPTGHPPLLAATAAAVLHLHLSFNCPASRRRCKSPLDRARRATSYLPPCSQPTPAATSAGIRPTRCHQPHAPNPSSESPSNMSISPSSSAPRTRRLGLPKLAVHLSSCSETSPTDTKTTHHLKPAFALLSAFSPVRPRTLV